MPSMWTVCVCCLLFFFHLNHAVSVIAFGYISRNIHYGDSKYHQNSHGNTPPSSSKEQQGHDGTNTVNKAMMGHAGVEPSQNRPRQQKEVTRENFGPRSTSGNRMESFTNKTNKSTLAITKNWQHNDTNHQITRKKTQTNNRAREEAEVQESERIEHRRKDWDRNILTYDIGTAKVQNNEEQNWNI